MSSARARLRLFDLAWVYRGRYLLGLVALIATDALELAAPAIIAVVIDSLSTRWEASGFQAWIVALTGVDYAMLALLLVAVVAVQGVLRYYWRVGFVFTSLYIADDLRRIFFAKLTRLPQAYYHANETGDLLSRASNDVEAVRMFLGIGILLLADTLLYFLFVPMLLFWWSPRLTVWLLVGLPILPLIIRRIMKLVHERFERVQEELSNLSAHAQEAFAGVVVVRGAAREEAETRRFATHAEEYKRRTLDLWRVQTWMGPTMFLAIIIGEVVIILVGGAEVLAGRLSAGQLVAFIFYLVMLTGPMEAIGWVLSLNARARASFGRILQVLDTPEVIDDRRAAPDAGITAGAIEFERVSLVHEGAERPALADLDLRLPAGAKLGIVGRVGSGKTTFARLLLRMMEASGGRILIDGRETAEYPLTELRGAIGFVPQETFLFSATLAENIGLPLAAPTREEIARAASLAALDEEIASWPDGLDTMIGERGVTLSGGQKQRVALARALIGDPRILLLDDCMSAVDTRTERRILDGIAVAARGRTTIIISQRLAALADADLILVLAEGRVLARGTHAELIDSCAWYRDTYLEQEAGGQGAAA